MASALGIDLGSVYRTAEAVKASRFEREQKEAAAGVATQTNALAVQAAGGDEAATAQLIGLDPARAKAITDAYTAMDEAARATAAAEVDAIGRLAAGVLAASDPAAAYKQMLAELGEAGRGLPQEYDESYVEFQLGRATEIDKIYSQIAGNANAERDQGYHVSNDTTDHTQAVELKGIDQTNTIANNATAAEVDATAREDDQVHDVTMAGVNHQNALAQDVAKGVINIEVESAKAGAAAGIDTPDASLIYRQAGGLLGGTFDQEGNLQGLDPSLAAKVQEISVRAGVYFKTDGPTKGDHAASVKQAATELGVEFPGAAATPPGPAAAPAPAPGYHPNNPFAPAPAGAPAPAPNALDPFGFRSTN